MWLPSEALISAGEIWWQGVTLLAELISPRRATLRPAVSQHALTERLSISPILPSRLRTTYGVTFLD